MSKPEEVKWEGPYKVDSVCIGEFETGPLNYKTASPMSVIYGKKNPRKFFVTRVEGKDIYGYWMSEDHINEEPQN